MDGRERLLVVVAFAVLVGGSAYDFSFPAQGTARTFATSSLQSSSSSTEYVASNSGISTSGVGSSSSFSSSVSSSAAVQPANQSAAQYPLVWAPNSPTVCADRGICFINATLALSNRTSSTSTTMSTTTIINNMTTTIVHGYTTTIIRGNSTDAIFNYPPAFETVAVTAYFQDAATGQNVTTSSGAPTITFGCDIQATGFSNCYIGGSVPPGHTYKVTVFITKSQLPCQFQELDRPCTIPLLAPIKTITITA
jgi:hypothetical protein